MQRFLEIRKRNWPALALLTVGLTPLAVGFVSAVAERSGFISLTERLSMETGLTSLVLLAVVSAAVRRQRLQENDAERLSTALSENVARLRLLHAVTSDPETSLPDKAASLLEQVRKTLGVEHAALLKVDGPDLVTDIWCPEAARPFTLGLDGHVAQQTFLHEGPVVFEGEIPGGISTRLSIGGAQIVSLLTQRLIVDSKPFGILLLASTELRDRPFAPDDLDQTRLCARWLEFELNSEASEKALRESEALLKNLAETIPGMVFQLEIEPGGKPRFRYVSDQIREVFGVAPADVLKHGDLLRHMTVEENGIARLTYCFAQSARTMSRFHIVLRYRVPTGEVRWIETFAQPQKFEDGVVRWSGVSLNVTEQRQTEKQLDEAQDRLAAILSSMEDVVFSLTPDACKTTFVSDACTHLLGYRPEQFIEDPDLFEKGVDDEDRLALADAFKAVASGRALDQEVRYFTRDGRMSWLRVRAHLVRDQHGTPIRIDGITTDVTPKKSSEVAFYSAKAEAEKANAAKSEFLSRMSHELRTPLNAILGFAQLLEIDKLTTNQRDSIEHILKAGRHLLELVNEVLDISRIEAGTLTMSLEPVELSRSLREAIALVRPMATARKIMLLFEPTLSPELHVSADRQRLRQVFLNLLSNAIKYSPIAGTVLVRATVAKNRAVVDIVDSGAGLSSSQIARLFTPFDRLGAEGSGVEGTGLGLPLAKRLLEGMGARLEVRSAPQDGSTFSAVMNLAEAPSSPITAVTAIAAPDVQDRRSDCEVLLIEDNLSNVRLVEEIVRTIPHTSLVSAMQGRLGLELAREHPPAAVLLDVNLPDVDGLELLRQMRAEKMLANVPVIVLSADATRGQIEKAMEAGADAYLTKPFNIRELIETLNGFLAGGRTHADS
jgi:PAS domain S-box-containing protein